MEHVGKKLTIIFMNLTDKSDFMYSEDLNENEKVKVTIGKYEIQMNPSIEGFVNKLILSSMYFHDICSNYYNLPEDNNPNNKEKRIGQLKPYLMI